MRDAAHGARELERRQAVDAVQRSASATIESSTPASTSGTPSAEIRARRADTAGRSRARGRERAEIGAVAVVRDHQIPGRVPARRRRREQVAEPAEAPRHAGRVERVARRAGAERQHRAHAGEPDQQARAPQRPPAVAHAPPSAPGSAAARAQCERARTVLARPARTRIRARRARSPSSAISSRRCRSSCLAARACETRRSRNWQEITIRAVISAAEMSRQARQRRRRHNRARAHTDSADRRRRARHRADRRRDRRGRLRLARRPVGAGARLAAAARRRRLLAGVRRRRHAARLHPVRPAAHARSPGIRYRRT